MRGGIRRWVLQVVKPKPAEVDAKFLRVGAGAYLHGESVLALLGLADVNPRHIKVAVPRRARPSLPPFVELTHVKADMRTTLYEGLSRELHRSAGERALPRAANPEPLMQRRPRHASPGRDGARRGRSDAFGGGLTTPHWRTRRSGFPRMPGSPSWATNPKASRQTNSRRCSDSTSLPRAGLSRRPSRSALHMCVATLPLSV